MSGYFWYFPLGNGQVHIGAGDFLKSHNHFVDEFLNKYDCEVIKKVGRPVRLTPPENCEPLKLKITGRFNMIKHGIDMLKLYRHMKSEEERYGMNVKMSDMLKVSQI
jgi:hypothetical protein